MEHLPSDISILKSLQVFEAFKAQLIKDFDFANFPNNFRESLPMNYEDLKETIMQTLKSGEACGSEISQLLYRIDIDEKQLKSYLLKYKDAAYYSVLSELIIKRILQKVIIQLHYKKQYGS